MSNGQGSSPQAEAIQKKMDALMTRYLTMKAALLVQSAIDNSMLLCAASGSWMVQLALSLDQVCFQNGSQGWRNRGAGRACAFPDFGRSVNPIQTMGGGQIMPTTLLLAPQIFRPTAIPVSRLCAAVGNL